MIDYIPRAGHIQAACRAGLNLVQGGRLYWMGSKDQIKSVTTHYKNITREYERGKSRPKGA